MSKKGGKSTPKQLDKTENRVTPTNEFIPGIPDTEWDFLNEVDQVYSTCIYNIFLYL